MARYCQAIHGHQAIHGWPGPSVDGLGPRLARNTSIGCSVFSMFAKRGLEPYNHLPLLPAVAPTVPEVNVNDSESNSSRSNDNDNDNATYQQRSSLPTPSRKDGATAGLHYGLIKMCLSHLQDAFCDCALDTYTAVPWAHVQSCPGHIYNCALDTFYKRVVDTFKYVSLPHLYMEKRQKY